MHTCKYKYKCVCIHVCVSGYNIPLHMQIYIVSILLFFRFCRPSSQPSRTESTPTSAPASTRSSLPASPAPRRRERSPPRCCSASRASAASASPPVNKAHIDYLTTRLPFPKHNAQHRHAPQRRHIEYRANQCPRRTATEEIVRVRHPGRATVKADAAVV